MCAVICRKATVALPDANPYPFEHKIGVFVLGKGSGERSVIIVWSIWCVERYLSLFLTLFGVYGSWFCEELWNVVSLIFGGLVEIGWK